MEEMISPRAISVESCTLVYLAAAHELVVQSSNRTFIAFGNRQIQLHKHAKQTPNKKLAARPIYSLGIPVALVACIDALGSSADAAWRWNQEGAELKLKRVRSTPVAPRPVEIRLLRGPGKSTLHTNPKEGTQLIEMGRRSSDTEEESRSKRKKKHRRRSSSSSSSDSRTYSRKKSGRKSRSKSRSWSRDLQSRSHSYDRRRRHRSSSSSSYGSRRKRSRSRSRGRGKSYRLQRSRSKSRTRRSRSRPRLRSHSRSSERSSHRRTRSRSRDRDRRKGRDKEKREKEKEKAKDKELHNIKRGESGNIKAGLEHLPPAEQAKARLQLVLEAAAKADEALKAKERNEEEAKRRKEEDQATLVEQVKRVKEIEAIESESFVQQSFRSSKEVRKAVEPSEVKQAAPAAGPAATATELPSVGKELDPSSIPTAIKYQDDNSLAHPNLFIEKAEAEEKWFKRLIALRQERLMGSPVA
ncbi:serine/Arginine-related protein 53 [Dipodomys merriami]|uniref:serine/Arginine-related protein 53 n=1 Tax=Dipodomys merriami TaxID=94247 RepID=UPI003855997D